MTKRYEIYKCDICGNVVEVLIEGAGELVCCGEAMKLQEEKKEGYHQEIHIPVFEKQLNNEVLVKIGENPHPMEEKHHIQLIEIFTNNGLLRKYLEITDKPEFLAHSDQKFTFARGYCNIHGLWKGENHDI